MVKRGLRCIKIRLGVDILTEYSVHKDRILPFFTKMPLAPERLMQSSKTGRRCDPDKISLTNKPLTKP